MWSFESLLINWSIGVYNVTITTGLVYLGNNGGDITNCHLALLVDQESITPCTYMIVVVYRWLAHG